MPMAIQFYVHFVVLQVNCKFVHSEQACKLHTNKKILLENDRNIKKMVGFDAQCNGSLRVMKDNDVSDKTPIAIITHCLSKVHQITHDANCALQLLGLN